MHPSVHCSTIYNSQGVADAQDGGVEGCALIFFCENSKITTFC